jgi:hypothetical protein
LNRIHKLAAVGTSALMVAFAFAPAALAAPAASGRSSALTAKTLPNANIKGKPAHFTPSTLSAKARWTKGATCTASVASFTISNYEKKGETVTFTGRHFQTFSSTIPKRKVGGFCISKGYTGTLTGKLKDGKKLKIHF